MMCRWCQTNLDGKRFAFVDNKGNVVCYKHTKVKTKKTLLRHSTLKKIYTLRVEKRRVRR